MEQSLIESTMPKKKCLNSAFSETTNSLENKSTSNCSHPVQEESGKKNKENISLSRDICFFITPPMEQLFIYDVQTGYKQNYIRKPISEFSIPLNFGVCLHIGVIYISGGEDCNSKDLLI